MIETPLFGRFQGENKRLAFLAPLPYLALVRGCLYGGGFAIVYGVFGPAVGIEPPLFPQWWALLGVMLIGAGVLAALSLQSVVFDLREGTYRRRQGPGLFPTSTFGRLSDLDAVVLIAEVNPRLLAGGVTYHLVLHWKAMREPPMVLQQDTRTLGTGQPLNGAAGPIVARGMQYAKALGVTFYDNSHFASPNPVPLLR